MDDKEKLIARDHRTVTAQAGQSAVADSVSVRRRRPIKASAAAVPAIMTLRSGAAAAMTSLNRCVEQDANRAAIELEDADYVWGDDVNEAALDEWVRVTGRAGKMIVTGGNSWYCIKNSTQTALWDDIAGWDCYDKNGGLFQGNIPASLWDTATPFYCVPDNATGWECVDETGAPLVIPIPEVAIQSGREVYLLAYVQFIDGKPTGSYTFYPKVALIQDQSVTAVTGSCLCSVDPNFNIM